MAFAGTIEMDMRLILSDLSNLTQRLRRTSRGTVPFWTGNASNAQSVHYP
jgi:hypothetical protein